MCVTVLPEAGPVARFPVRDASVVVALLVAPAALTVARQVQLGRLAEDLGAAGAHAVGAAAAVGLVAAVGAAQMGRAVADPPARVTDTCVRAVLGGPVQGRPHLMESAPLQAPRDEDVHPREAFWVRPHLSG